MDDIGVSRWDHFKNFLECWKQVFYVIVIQFHFHLEYYPWNEYWLSRNKLNYSEAFVESPYHPPWLAELMCLSHMNSKTNNFWFLDLFFVCLLLLYIALLFKLSFFRQDLIHLIRFQLNQPQVVLAWSYTQITIIDVYSVQITFSFTSRAGQVYPIGFVSY